MRFIVEIPDSNLFGGASEESVRQDVLGILGKAYNWSGNERVQVMIDDRPDPMDFVKSIFVGHPDGSTCTQVMFTNGSSICSCSWQAGRSERISYIPNLRESLTYLI